MVDAVFDFSFIRKTCGRGSSVDIATTLWAGRSGDRILVVARSSTPVQTVPEAHPASCTMGTGLLPTTPSSAEAKERVEL
jgi:hypothetical protein